LLGATGTVADAQPAAGARLTLVGVVAGPSGAGAALISVDGAPARPYRVGREVPGALFLQSLQPRLARLGPQPDGPTTLTLELPALAPLVLQDKP
jgi:general secretion pathway protein C